MFVEMAEITRAVGLRGELKLSSYGDFDLGILRSDYLRLRTRSGEQRTVRLRSIRQQGESAIVRLSGVDDRTSAETLVGAGLGFLAEDYDRPDFPRPQLPSPFCYEGLRVLTTSGESVGEVAELLLWPGQRMLRVRRPGREDVLVPAVPPILQSMDREAGRIVIEPIPGLLDDDAELAG
jgi:16S rRNA processing protein RimM